MHRKLTSHHYASRLAQECKNEIDSYVIDDDGTMHKKGGVIDILPGYAACPLALKHAAAFKITSSKKFQQFAQACLAAAERGLVENGGVRFWPHEAAVSLCAQGRWIRNAYYAATAVGDQAALAWLADMMDRWPYAHGEHRFVERMMAGPMKPTSVNGFSHSFNMLCEGAVDGWMLGKAAGNRALMDRSEDEIVNFTLPGQRDDGHWSYRARSANMSATDSCNPGEFNYSFYLTLLLSNLLQFPEWKDRLAGPVRKSYDALRDEFEFDDGSIYAPVHWGWNHLFESTTFSMLVAWRLCKHCGLDGYGEAAARAVHWCESAQLQGWSLFWDRHFLELLLDDFEAEADVAEPVQIMETLNDFERRLGTPYAGDMAYGRYFADLPLILALQRKTQYLLNRMKGHKPGRVDVPRWPEMCEPIFLTWDKDPDVLDTWGSFAWDDDNLYVQFSVANNGHWQPYSGFELFRGDGVIMCFHNGGGHDVRVNLALTERGAYAFLYNPELPYGLHRSWLPKGTSEGRVLDGADVVASVSPKAVVYTASLSWKELGISPASGKAMPFSFTSTKLQPIGWQHVTWGKDPFDEFVADEPGQLVLT